MSLLFWSVSPLFLLMAAAEPNKETQKEFSLVADAITQAQSCESLGFSVDRDGLVDWSQEAKGRAMEQGMSQADADAMMQDGIDADYARMKSDFEKMKRMANSPDHVQRHNYKLRKGCRKLAKHEKAGLYYSEGED